MAAGETEGGEDLDGEEVSELVVLAEFDEPLFKAVELLHEGYDHAESIVRFGAGSGVASKSVIAGEYCADRMVFDMVAVGGVARPAGPCFRVSAHETTFVWLQQTTDGYFRVSVAPGRGDREHRGGRRPSGPGAPLVTSLDLDGALPSDPDEQ